MTFSYKANVRHGSAADETREELTKADSTLRSSQAVPHPSTNRALRRLTSEVERDPVHSTRYGRQRECMTQTDQYILGSASIAFASASVSGPCYGLQ